MRGLGERTPPFGASGTGWDAGSGFNAMEVGAEPESEFHTGPWAQNVGRR